VTVEGNVVGEIGAGLLVLLGVARPTAKLRRIPVEKIVGLRIFEDAEGKMNLSVQTHAAQFWWFHSSRSMAMSGEASGRRLTVRPVRKSKAGLTNYLPDKSFVGPALPLPDGPHRQTTPLASPDIAIEREL